MITYKNEISVAHRLLESSSFGRKTSFPATGGASHVLLNKPAQLQAFAKSFDQPHSAEVRMVRFPEGKTDQSGSFWHMPQSTLLGRFVARRFSNPNYTFLRSEN